MKVYQVEYCILNNCRVIASTIIETFIFEENAKRYVSELNKSIDNNHSLNIIEYEI